MRYLIDLHCHLDGCITVEIARKLAKLQGISLPAEADEELLTLLSVSADCQSLDEFLQCFSLPLSLMQTKPGISEAVFLVQEMLMAQGLAYAELRFAPQLHCEQGLTQEEVLLAALDGLSRSEFSCNLILCCMRGDTNHAANLETVTLAHKYLVTNDGVTALDLAGAEGLFPTKHFQDLFALAKKLQIPFTIHAGEAGDAESVRCAINMGAARIGHGIHAIEDKTVLQLLKEKQIPLELCPTSNLLTKAAASKNAYPLRSFLEQGISVTINTDDMAICRTTLADEYHFIQTAFAITHDETLQLLNNAIEAAFTDTATKQNLKAELLSFR